VPRRGRPWRARCRGRCRPRRTPRLRPGFCRSRRVCASRSSRSRLPRRVSTACLVGDTEGLPAGDDGDLADRVGAGGEHAEQGVPGFVEGGPLPLPGDSTIPRAAPRTIFSREPLKSGSGCKLGPMPVWACTRPEATASASAAWSRSVGGIQIRVDLSTAALFALIAFGLAAWQSPAANPHQATLTYALAAVVTTVGFFEQHHAVAVRRGLGAERRSAEPGRRSADCRRRPADQPAARRGFRRAGPAGRDRPPGARWSSATGTWPASSRPATSPA